ncbi:MAG: OmpA family protein [Chitinophagaceae bacterium]
MKKIILGVFLIGLNHIANAQIKGILDRAKQKTANKANEKVNNKVDNTADSAFNKKEKPATEPVKNTPETPAEKQKTVESEAAVKVKTDSIPPASTSIKAFSKYDFVPGEKIVGFEDYMTGSIGDFPAGWNTTGSAEIVTIDGKPGRWLMITKAGVFVPEFINKLPDNFTFEFDLVHGTPFQGGNSVVLNINLTQLNNISRPQEWTMASNNIRISLLPGNTGTQSGSSGTELRKNATSEAATSTETKQLGDQYNPVHVSIWRQKERVRVYCNEEKVWDLPKALAKDAQLNALIFSLQYAEPTSQYFLGNLRLAVGIPDTRNKFLTEGKWVTHGILFDVNSANIKAESYGSLKEIANVLKENTDVKVKIVGHTDSDGSDANNLDLSKRRAASVKAMLTKEFIIDESRMQTDGMGESKPIDKNDNPAGKANNRRVEFIKL